MAQGKGTMYIPTTTKAGRRFVGAKGGQVAVKPLSDHNAAIEAKRQEELAARKARRAGK